MNPRPLGYEPNELPDCSTPRQETPILARDARRELGLMKPGEKLFIIKDADPPKP